MSWTDDPQWYGRAFPHTFDIVSPFAPVVPSETGLTFEIHQTPAPIPRGWECPRCKTINAPHAMTCHGQECGGAK